MVTLAYEDLTIDLLIAVCLLLQGCTPLGSVEFYNHCGTDITRPMG